VTAALLSTYIQTTMVAQDLIEATRWGTTSATLDSTGLEALATEAIQEFQLEMGTWNPTVYAWHYTIGSKLLMKLLWSRTTGGEAMAQKYERELAPMLQRYRRARTLVPTTTNVTTPTPIVSGSRPAIDDRTFDGYAAKPTPALEPSDDD